MGHRCCSKQKVKRGLWSPEEDDKLVKHITTHGHGSWSSVPKLASLQRCGKSCRLRWINYLRPDLKKGSFTEEEEQIIIDVHRILGNRWAQIAKHLPGRTDNEVKNFWNSCIKKKLMSQGLDPQTHNLLSTNQLRASNSGHNHKKNVVSSFVVSHDSHEQQPVSVFSMTSSSSQEHQVSPFDLTLPDNAAISTVDHDHHRYQNPQKYYDIPSSSSSSHAHVHRQPSSSALLDHDFSIWDNSSNFEPSFEANRQTLINDLDHHVDHQEMIKQMNHDNQEKGQIQKNDQTSDDLQEKHSSFDLGFMESALMSDFVYNNDFSSMEYDIAWNY